MKQRILIVDDDIRACRIVQQVAESSGYKIAVINAADNFDACRHAFNPTVIVLNLKLQGADSVALLCRLAQHPTPVPVILLGAMDNRVIIAAQHLGKSIGLNVLGALRKPLNADKLEQVLRRASITATDNYSSDKPHPTTAVELARAIREDQLFIRYQPKIDLATQQVIGIEALARWLHPVHDVRPPNEFIPLAEAAELITPLTFKLLERILRDALAWPNSAAELSLAVNLSATLLDDQQLPERLLQMLSTYNLAPERLVLEINESALMSASLQSLETLTRLRIQGIQLAIDDLGTGATLLPIHCQLCNELKIDKSLIMEAEESFDAETIVRSIVEQGHRHGLNTVAEGIENYETMEWLTKIGCDRGQGFYISPPFDAAQLPPWLAEWRRGNAWDSNATCHHYGI